MRDYIIYSRPRARDTTSDMYSFRNHPSIHRIASCSVQGALVRIPSVGPLPQQPLTIDMACHRAEYLQGK